MTRKYLLQDPFSKRPSEWLIFYQYVFSILVLGLIFFYWPDYWPISVSVKNARGVGSFMAGLGSDLEMRLLLLGNLMPLVSVIFFGADLWFLMLLYWLENFIAGGFNALMMLTSTGRGLSARIFFAGFFSVHYGIFTFVHLFFLIIFISGERDILRYLSDYSALLVFNAVMLSLSYLWGFISDWWPRRGVNPETLMSAPYGRIIVLQLTIILGAFAAVFFGGNMGFLVILVLVRTLLDVYIYLRARIARAPQVGNSQ